MYIKYSASDENFTRLRAFDYEDFAKSVDYLREQDPDNINTADRDYPYPFIVRADEISFFVNPTPDESVTDGLKITGTYFPLDLSSDSTESDIKLQREFHELISLGMEKYVY